MHSIDVLIGRNGSGLARVSLDVRDLTLREIMNRIIKSPGFRAWRISRSGAKNQYLTIAVN
jgi:hypothetical protein